MKILLLKLLFLSVVFSLLTAGCDSLKLPAEDSENVQRPSDPYSILSRYAPVKVNIMPLTKFEKANQKQTQIHVYVSLLDYFGSQIKSPNTLRFELYEKVQLSTQPKGSRIVIWPDLDLTDPKDNNKYWSDFFRAYEFRLGFEPKEDKSYIFQATAIDLDGKRLSDEITINAP